MQSGIIGHHKYANGKPRFIEYRHVLSDGMPYVGQVVYGTGCKWAPDCFECKMPQCCLTGDVKKNW